MRGTVAERAGLAAAAVVLVLSGLVLATGASSENTTTAAFSSPSPTAALTAAPVATAPPAATPTPAPSAKPKAPVASSAPSRAAAPVRPPAPGRYDYTATDADGSGTSTLDISDQGGGKQVENEDGGQIDEVLWTSGTKLDQATTFNFGQFSIRCDWNPDLTEYEFPLTKGKSWKEDGSCDRNGTSIAAAGTVRVSGPSHDSVGGTVVDTWILISDATLTVKSPSDSFTEKIHYEDHFAPSRGLTVKDIQDTTDTSSSGQTSTDRRTRVLQSFSPGTSA